MANYSISANQIAEGKSVLIRGKLSFARLTRTIDGEELVKSNQRKLANGMSPIDKPHTTATITQAEVLFADPANPTLEEQFVSERRYLSKTHPDTGPNYSIDSKGTQLPVIAIPSAKNDGTYDQDVSGQELARDIDVTLVLRTYKPKNYNNRGLALEQVIVNEAPRYYAASASTEQLAARGIVFNAPPRALQAGDAPAVGAVQEFSEAISVPEGSEIRGGLAFPAPPTAAPAPAPVQAVAAPVPAPVAVAVTAPVPVAAPVQVAVPVAAVQAPVSAPVAAAAEETPEQRLAKLEAENAALKAAQAVPAGGPVSPWDDQPAGGITFQG